MDRASDGSMKNAIALEAARTRGDVIALPVPCTLFGKLNMLFD